MGHKAQGPGGLVAVEDLHAAGGQQERGAGKEAEAAMDGPQGGELRVAEEEARGHSKAPGNEA